MNRNDAWNDCRRFVKVYKVSDETLKLFMENIKAFLRNILKQFLDLMLNQKASEKLSDLLQKEALSLFWNKNRDTLTKIKSFNYLSKLMKKL